MPLPRAGTTTAVLYGAVYEDSLDASFQAAEAHGMRVVMGKVMMDRLRYDASVRDAEVLELSLRQTPTSSSAGTAATEGVCATQ